MNANETILRNAFRTMDAHKAQEIRDAYYKALEGLRTLAETLEIEDAKNPGPASDLLINEHLLAIHALDTMHKSNLGLVL